MPSNTQPTLQGAIPVRVETDQEKSCREFVQEFYDWYFGRLNLDLKSRTEGPVSNDVLRLRPDILAPRLRKLLKQDSEAQAKESGYVVGLDSDPFINAQDWDGTYAIGNVSVSGGNCRASVWGTDAGAKREMVDPELKYINGKWVFVNFHKSLKDDPQDRENLIDQLLMQRGDRDSSKR